MKLFEEFVSNVDLSKSEVKSLLNELSNLLKSKGLVIEYEVDDREDPFRKPDIEYTQVKINVMYNKPLEGFDKLTREEMVSQYSEKFLELSKVIDKFLIKWRERLNKVNLMLIDK